MISGVQKRLLSAGSNYRRSHLQYCLDTSLKPTELREQLEKQCLLECFLIVHFFVLFQAMQTDVNTQFVDHVIDILNKVLTTYHDDASDSFGFYSIETLMLSLAKLVAECTEEKL